MLARVWLVVPLLGGCNQLLGLDPTSRAGDAGTTGDASMVDSGNDACPEPGELGFEDEDGDSLDDRCDNCPANANLDQGDADLDDVGDICDATETPSRIAFFDGFHDGDLAGWVESGVASWRSTGDAAVLENGTGISVLLADGVDIDNGRVVAPIEIVALPTAIDHIVGVAFSAFQLDGYTCVADEMGTSTTAQAVLYAQTGGTPTALATPMTLTGSFIPGAVLSADARWSDGGQTCTVELGGSAIVTAFDATYPSGSAGVYAQGAEVRVPYVIVYEEL
jgi:hypothetical protein